MEIDKHRAVITFIFSITAFFIVFSRISVPIAGTEISMDPGEIFITLGAFFTGIPGAVVIVIFRSIASAIHHPPGIAFATFTAHLAGGIFIALFCHFIRKQKGHPFYQFFLWIAGVSVYYYGFIILIFNFVSFLLARDTYLQNFGGEVHIWKLYTIIAVSVLPEVLFTIFLTSAVLFLLPKKYRGV